MSAVAVLRKARFLIAEPEFWTKGRMARYLKLEQRDGRPEQTLAYCSLGAIQEASYQVEPMFGRRGQLEAEARKALFRAIETGEYVGIETWNDSPARTHKQVLTAFDKAIAEAEAVSAS